MDREALRSKAASRRNKDDEVVLICRRVLWSCEACAHDFATETGFMRHACKGRAKIDELQSPVGQAAYAFYSEWMSRSKRKAPPIETFAGSKLYSTFIKFAKHVVRVRLPNVSGFIRTMVDNGNVQPSLWCRDNVYAMYLQGYDAVVTPTQQFVSSLDEMYAFAKEFNCYISDVYNQLGVETILDLVQKRKLSPWFLISSVAFRGWMMQQSEENADRLEAAIQVGALLARVSHSEALRTLLTDFSRATKELGL